jgi:hypothetical protein
VKPAEPDATDAGESELIVAVGVDVRKMFKVAEWLVVVLSLLSNSTLTVPAGSIRNPLLATPFSQLCTAAVTSTVRNRFVAGTATPLATDVPATGALLPFTAVSDQGPLATKIFTFPEVETFVVKRVSVALKMFAGTKPAGNALKSN